MTDKIYKVTSLSQIFQAEIKEYRTVTLDTNLVRWNCDSCQGRFYIDRKDTPGMCPLCGQENKPYLDTLTVNSTET